MKTLIIDNYDSFTYNLYQYTGEILIANNIGGTIDVKRNNEITIAEIEKKNFQKIIISPGPGDPRMKEYFGVCAEIITKLGKKTPILGICLGMQGMAYYFGGEIVRAKQAMHGKKSTITHDEKGVFHNIPQKIEVMRYHSLVVEKEMFPSCLSTSAIATGTGEIMGIRHNQYPIEGIQFHPESFATESGKQLLKNFLMNQSI